MTKKEFDKKCAKLIWNVVGCREAPTIDALAFELDVHPRTIHDVINERRSATIPMIVNYHWFSGEPYECMDIFDEPVLDDITEEEWRSMSNELEEYEEMLQIEEGCGELDVDDEYYDEYYDPDEGFRD